MHILESAQWILYKRTGFYPVPLCRMLKKKKTVDSAEKAHYNDTKFFFEDRRMTYRSYTNEYGTQTGSCTSAASFCGNRIWISGAVVFTASVLLCVIHLILGLLLPVIVLVLLLLVLIMNSKQNSVKTDFSFS